MSTNKKKTAKAAPKKMIVLHHTAVKRPAAVKVEMPKSHPFVRTLVDVKTRILIAIMAGSAHDQRAKTAPAAVFVSTIIGNVFYKEQVEFETFPRALEYVADFGQAQSNRFATAAIEHFKKMDPELNPPMQMTAKEPGIGQKP